MVGVLRGRGGVSVRPRRGAGDRKTPPVDEAGWWPCRGGCQGSACTAYGVEACGRAAGRGHPEPGRRRSLLIAFGHHER